MTALHLEGTRNAGKTCHSSRDGVQTVCPSTETGPGRANKNATRATTAQAGVASRLPNSSVVPFRHARDGVMSTRQRVRSGWRMPTSIATLPPMLWPSTCAEGISRASSSDSTQRANMRAS